MCDISALIQQWQNGDERAGEALYSHYREPIFRLAYGLLGDAADAEEVAQDALAYALNRIGQYDAARSSFSTWLHTIAVSRCRDRQRRRRLPWLSLTAWLQQGGDVRDPTPNPEAQAIRLEVQGQVWHAIQALSPPLREAILLRYWAEHTFQEIAIITGCPVSTAQSRVRLAFQQLRAAIAPTVLADLREEQVR
jgi:RNA polymerase sigma-70 factor, ECF subfamily